MKSAAILDIGSSKVVCLCGSNGARGGIVIHGAGIAKYAGYESGTINDEKSLEQAIVNAIRDAEETARRRIRDISVAVNTPFSKLIVTSASMRPETPKSRITAADIDELISLSLERAKAPEYVLMHSTPISFTVDGAETGEAPEGRRASEISARVSHMYVQESFLSLVTRILKGLSIEISMCASTPFAEALLLIPEEARLRPSVLIDVGYTHTDVALMENSALTNMATIDIGGMHFTKDLAYGLSLPFENAEQVKRRYSFLEGDEKETETVRTVTGVRKVDAKVIDLVMDARAEELSGLIKKTLRQLGIRLESRPVTYLTGGGLSMVRGGGEYLRQHLGLHIRRDMPYMPGMDTPNYASAFGVLDFTLRSLNGGDEPDDVEETSGGFIGKIKDLLHR